MDSETLYPLKTHTNLFKINGSQQHQTKHGFLRLHSQWMLLELTDSRKTMSVMLQMSLGNTVIHTEPTTAQYCNAWEGFQFPEKICILTSASSSIEQNAPVFLSFFFHPSFSCKWHLTPKGVLLFRNKMGRAHMIR